MPGGIINILYINPTAKMSGAEFSLVSLLEKINRKRFNPILLLPQNGPFYDKANKIGIETLILPTMIKFSEGHNLSTFPKIVKAVYQLTHLIQKKNIQLVHSNSPRTAYIGGIAAKLTSIPSVIHVRDIHLSPFSHPLKARFLNILSDEIVAVSSATRDSILKSAPYLEPKIKVVYNGVDIKRLESIRFKDIRNEFGLKKDVPVIGCVGIIHPAKGQDILIQATALIKKSFPHVKVFLIGGIFLKKAKNYENELRRLTKKLGLEEIVVFTGFRSDVFDLINAMDVVVHPAIYPDPFPRSLLEASAIGKAIVATRVGGIPEMLENDVSALLIEPSVPIAIAEAVEHLLSEKTKARELASEAKSRIEKNFSIERHVENITAIYERLLRCTS